MHPFFSPLPSSLFCGHLCFVLICLHCISGGVGTIAQWGQPLLLDAVAGIMGLVMDLKIYL